MLATSARRGMLPCKPVSSAVAELTVWQCMSLGSAHQRCTAMSRTLPNLDRWPRRGWLFVYTAEMQTFNTEELGNILAGTPASCIIKGLTAQLTMYG